MYIVHENYPAAWVPASMHTCHWPALDGWVLKARILKYSKVSTVMKFETNYSSCHFLICPQGKEPPFKPFRKVRHVIFRSFQGYTLCEKDCCSCSLKGSLREAVKKGRSVTLVTSNPSSIPFSSAATAKKRSLGPGSLPAYNAILYPSLS